MFKSRAHVINLILGIILIAVIIANVITVINYRSSDRFEWSHGVYTTQGNTIQVADCNFNFDKNSYGYAISRTRILNNGREDINFAEKGVENKFYPNQLYICWYSYTEKKFYEGNFDLPYNQINRIAEQLRKTTNAYDLTYARANPNKIDLNFIAEVRPKGEVAVYISDLQKYIEIGKYKAKSVQKTIEIFEDSNGAISKTDPPNVAIKTALVMERYPYTIQTHFPANLKLRGLSVDPYNQNNWKLEKNKLNTFPQLINIPQSLGVTWGTDSKEYYVEYYFQAEEILAAFRSLNALSNSSDIKLMFDVNEKNDNVLVSLQRGNKSIKLNYAYDELDISDRIPQKDDE